MLRIKNSKQHEKGSTLVEFSIGATVFLMVTFGVLEFGRALWAHNALVDAARRGTRYAVLHQPTGEEDTKIRNLVVYGDPDGGTTPMLPGSNNRQRSGESHRRLFSELGYCDGEYHRLPVPVCTSVSPAIDQYAGVFNHTNRGVGRFDSLTLRLVQNSRRLAPKTMTEPITCVVLSTGLDNFKDIRRALTAESRVKLLAGGNDADQLYEEIVRLKPAAAIIALGPNADQAVRFIERLNAECPGTTLISAAQDASPDLILRSLRAGAREFLRIPISAEELRTVLDRVSDFCTKQVETPKKKGRMVAVFSSKGGCGTSFIATNLAAATASEDRSRRFESSGRRPAAVSGTRSRSIRSPTWLRNGSDSTKTLINSLVTPHSDQPVVTGRSARS